MSPDSAISAQEDGQSSLPTEFLYLLVPRKLSISPACDKSSVETQTLLSARTIPAHPTGRAGNRFCPRVQCAPGRVPGTSIPTGGKIDF